MFEDQMSVLPERFRPSDYDEIEHGGDEYLIVGESGSESVFRQELCSYSLVFKLNSDSTLSMSVEEGFAPVLSHAMNESTINFSPIQYSPSITLESELTSTWDRESSFYSFIPSDVDFNLEEGVMFDEIPWKEVTFQSSIALNSECSIEVNGTSIIFDVFLDLPHLERLKNCVVDGGHERLILRAKIPLWVRVNEEANTMWGLTENGKAYFFECAGCSRKKIEVTSIIMSGVGGEAKGEEGREHERSDGSDSLAVIEMLLKGILLRIDYMYFTVFWLAILLTVAVFFPDWWAF